MVILEINGKKYVEYELYKKADKRKLISILFLTFMALAIIAMIIAITILVKNKDIIQSDPLRYGMDVHGFVSCQCLDEEGQAWYSEGTGFATTRSGEGIINYSNLRLDPNIFNQGVDG